jgi:hypothetical protein
MFSVEYRQKVSSRVLVWAESDQRIVAGARIGSLAHGPGDRWSDLDLTFAVSDDARIADVLEDWTGRLVAEFDTIRLFDLPSGRSIYRVFLLPGCLQFDSSFPPRLISAPLAPSSSCSSGLQWRNPISARQPLQTCLDMRCIMRYVPAFASNATVTVRLNTGSVHLATTR